jgi:hypothetical protein
MSFEHDVMRTCDVPYKYSTVVRGPSGILARVMRVADTQPVDSAKISPPTSCGPASRIAKLEFEDLPHVPANSKYIGIKFTNL